jgi:hypothetical protein
MDETRVPLMIHLRCEAPRPRHEHWYDETQQLNVVLHHGEVRPVVSVPGSLANLKTVLAAGGED